MVVFICDFMGVFRCDFFSLGQESIQTIDSMEKKVPLVRSIGGPIGPLRTLNFISGIVYVSQKLFNILILKDFLKSAQSFLSFIKIIQKHKPYVTALFINLFVGRSASSYTNFLGFMARFCNCFCYLSRSLNHSTYITISLTFPRVVTCACDLLPVLV